MRTHPTARRLAAIALALALTPAVTVAVAAPAHAAPTPFIVFGTSDVSDSNLMAAVIEPGFEKAYPQYDLQYKAFGTGTAISNAEKGQAAALLVHAASLENQFVSQGYSLEAAGRSIFWGDYVLLGPSSDPAGVMNGSEHDIIGALQKVATAGAAGTANFVSRGGTPGTAVQERALWAQTQGVPLCSVSSTKGGGARPTAGPTTCADPDDTTAAPFPAWYRTGDSASQAQNVAIANTCSFQGGNCYVFTDRGTFNYLQSIGLAQNLKIVTRDNDPAAKGGQSALINAFHAYGVNPAKFPGNGTVNTPATQLFLNFITSPAEQQQIGYYLGKDKPFVPAAAPVLTADFKGDTAASAANSVVKGNLANAIPGYPALSGETVNLLKANSDSPLAIPKIVATAKTNDKGSFTFRAKLKPGKFYSVGVAGITKVEDPTLNPTFSDILQPTTTSLGEATRVVLQPTAVAGGKAVLSGRVNPRAKGSKARLLVYAAHPGKKLKRVDSLKLRRHQSQFTVRTALGPGTWRVEVVYQNNKLDLIPTASAIRTVTIS